MKKHLCVILLFAATLATAQQGHQVLFPGTTGQELFDNLTTFYRPTVVLDYANARDTLYAKVFAKDNDTVRCIYSDHALYLSPTADPTQYIYLNGSSLGMNTEHAYPQAMGAADGNPRSDMHHLFATRIPVNEARGNLPYGDIPDAQTDKWYYKAQVVTTIPTVNKDLYSEKDATKFEPREAAKGDMARAVFYFYTMYKTQADLANAQFFEQQRPTLCQWNAQDPVDAAEMTKTWRIAPYQEGKPNPFIVDCTLAGRTYCPGVAPTCILSDKEPTVRLQASVAPQPFNNTTQLALELPFAGDLRAVLLSSDGREMATWQQNDLPAGQYQQPIQANVPAAAIWFLELRLVGKQGQVAVGMVPLVGI
jgi:hypothetical protein